VNDRFQPCSNVRQRASGERTLVVTDEGSWTYAQTREVAAKAAAVLAAAGIAPGDRGRYPKRQSAGVPGTRPGLRLARRGLRADQHSIERPPQIQYILGNCEAKLLAIESDLLPALQAADLSDLPLERILLLGQAAAGSTIQGRPCVAYSLGDEMLEAAPVRPGDTMAILYTSGTTGPSKGVCCPYAQYFWWSAPFGRRRSELSKATFY
jgi:crotonobetaine/carnitine-CoA ligase